MNVYKIVFFVDNVQPEKYLSVDEVVTSGGVELRKTENDYPITPDYVKSFADSSDYHKDLLSAVNNGVNGKNLGDITEVQRVAAMDTEQARALYMQLSERFSKKSDVLDVKSDVKVDKDV